MEEKKRIYTNIGVGSIVKAKVVEMEERKREGRTSRTRKEVVGCVQSLLRKTDFVVKFECGKKIEMSAYSLSYVCDKDEVGKDAAKTIYDLLKIGQD